MSKRREATRTWTRKATRVRTKVLRTQRADTKSSRPRAVRADRKSNNRRRRHSGARHCDHRLIDRKLNGRALTPRDLDGSQARFATPAQAGVSFPVCRYRQDLDRSSFAGHSEGIEPDCCAGMVQAATPASAMPVMLFGGFLDQPVQRFPEFPRCIEHPGPAIGYFDREGRPPREVLAGTVGFLNLLCHHGSGLAAERVRDHLPNQVLPTRRPRRGPRVSASRPRRSLSNFRTTWDAPVLAKGWRGAWDRSLASCLRVGRA